MPGNTCPGLHLSNTLLDALAWLLCLQLISAGLTWFLDGVYISLPTTAAESLNITVRLRDTTSALLTSGDYTQVQVGLCYLAHLALHDMSLSPPVLLLCKL